MPCLYFELADGGVISHMFGCYLLCAATALVVKNLQHFLLVDDHHAIVDLQHKKYAI